VPEAKVTTTVRMDPKVFDGMAKSAKKTGIAFQRIVEDACREYLEKRKQAA
jgi:hypothetical protein